MKKYYYAYEERYRKVHENDLLWFIDEPSEELIHWVSDNKINIDEDICEIGCGEGRDSIYLAEKGYRVTAIDISESAIKMCRIRAIERHLDIIWNVEDIVIPKQELTQNYKWIFSISTYHMLIEDEDQNLFLRNIHKMLKEKGQLLLVNKGNGIDQRKTNIEDSFNEEERTHMQTGKKLKLPSTSFRQEKWDDLIKKVEQNGFKVLKNVVTKNRNYDECMTLYLEKNS